MKNENRQHLERIREEIETYYDGFEEDGEEKTLFDYLSDILDFEILIDSRMEYRTCKVYLTLGGPNIWIDTEARALKLAWWTEKEEIYLDSDICDEIDFYFEELYNCR